MSTVSVSWEDVSNIGDSSTITKDFAQQFTLGCNSTLSCTGKYSVQSATQSRTKLKATGVGSKQIVSGCQAQVSSEGSNAIQISCGTDTRHKATGDNNVIMIAGRNSTFRGEEGVRFAITKYSTLGDGSEAVGIVTGVIGQDGIEPNVEYGFDAKGKLVPVSTKHFDGSSVISPVRYIADPKDVEEGKDKDETEEDFTRRVDEAWWVK